MLLAEGDAEGAVRELHNAIRHWRDVGAPYEVARDRGLLATALQRLRRDDEADLELQASREEFHRLGAVRDEAAADDAIRAAAGRVATPAITHKTFMFTDIVASTNLAEAMGDEAWEHLLRWHDDALRAVFLDHGGEVVNSTGDGFFVAFESPDDALACAVAIQRGLAEHRSNAGFAPQVRIGLHASDATMVGRNFTGKGVHEASRIGGLAEGNQIVASAETAVGGQYPTADPRTVTVKGISDPIEVVTVDWR